MMVTVYFKSKTHAEVVAVFPDEDMYNTCFEVLDIEAKKHRMIVTESVQDEIELDSLLEKIDS